MALFLLWSFKLWLVEALSVCSRNPAFLSRAEWAGDGQAENEDAGKKPIIVDRTCVTKVVLILNAVRLSPFQLILARYACSINAANSRPRSVSFNYLLTRLRKAAKAAS